MKEFFSTLCNNHNQVIHNLMHMKKMTKDAKLRETINETLEFVRFCKKQGIRMETRLKQYRNAIEDLGFIRDEPNK